MSPRKKIIRKAKSKKVNYQSSASESNSPQQILENDLVYPQSTFLAYIDPTSDDPSKFKICQLNQDVKTTDSEFNCDIFE